MYIRNLFILLTAIAVSGAPVFVSNAEARPKDRPNTGYCKSGKQVGHIKNCKENGGTK